MTTVEKMRGALTEWEAFLQAKSHVLLRRPALLFQEAANEPDTYSPARAARERQAAGLETRPWVLTADKAQQRSPCLLTLAGHTSEVSCCAFSPDGTRIASGSADRTVRVWNSRTGELIATLAGHGRNGITRCAFSPDGKFILSGVDEIPSSASAPRPMTALMAGLVPQALSAAAQVQAGDISLWDAQSGDHVRAFALDEHSRGKVACCAFSPDGNRVLAGGGEYAPGWLKVWDTATGREALSVAGKHRLSAGAWSHDGRRILAAWDAGKSLQVLDAVSGGALLTLTTGHEDPTACASSPDGHWIACASYSHLWLWDARSGEPAWDAQPRALSVQGCAFSPDGSRAVSRALESPEKAVTLWDPRSGEAVAWLSGHTGDVQAVTFSPDGSRLATASQDGTVRVWDAASGAEIAKLEGHGAGVNACAFSPDGARVVSASCDRTLKLWNPSVAASPRLSESPEALAGEVVQCPDGSLATVWREDHPYHQVRIVGRWDADARESRGQIRIVHPGRQSDFKGWGFSPDSRVLASWGTDGESVDHLFFWDASSGSQLGEVRECRGGPFTPDGRRMAGAGAHDIRFFDTTSLARVASVADEGNKHRKPLLFSPDGRHLVCDRGWFGLQILDGETGEPLIDIPTASEPCAMSPQGELLFATVGQFGGRAGLFRSATGEPLAAQSRSFSHPVRSCGFSPDGAFAAAGNERELALWDVRTGREVESLPGAAPFAFSPDGAMIAFAGGRQRLGIWSLSRLEPLCEHETGGRVISIVWRPDSARIVVSGGLGRVQFLRLVNVEAGPPVVTAWTWDDRCAYGCAVCRAWSETPKTMPGSGVRCPRCDTRLVLNPSTITADWKPVAAAWRAARRQ